MIEEEPKFGVVTHDLPYKSLKEGQIVEIKLVFQRNKVKYYLVTNGEKELLNCKCSSKPLYRSKTFLVEPKFIKRLRP